MFYKVKQNFPIAGIFGGVVGMADFGKVWHLNLGHESGYSQETVSNIFLSKIKKKIQKIKSLVKNQK